MSCINMTSKNHGIVILFANLVDRAVYKIPIKARFCYFLCIFRAL